MLSSPPSDTRQESSPAVEEVPERPALVAGVEFTGPMYGTGFTEQAWLIQRGGRLLQVPEPFYRVAEQIKGERTLEEIAAAVMRSTDWLVSADLVRQIIEKKLVPIGLVRTTDSAMIPRAEDRDHTPLQINLHRQEFGPGESITWIRRYLFTPPAIILLSITVGVASAWWYLVRGIGDGIRTVRYSARRFPPHDRPSPK